jgi:tellurite resistance protein TerC
MDVELPLAFEIGSYAVLILIIIADLVHAYRRPHIPSTKESGLWVAFYVGLALVFAVIMFFVGGAEHAGQFVAGWLTEYSLSIDNLFVFVIIMARFSVPRKYQQEVLMVGIILALIFRGIFIVAGAAIIEQFSAVFYLFGLFLIYTAINQAFTSHEDEEETENRLIAFLRKRIAITDEYDGAKVRTVVDKLVYLKYGIAFILAFIGVKLFFHALHENELPFINGGEHVDWAPEINTWTSLAVIIASMAIATIASLLKIRRDDRRASVESGGGTDAR